MDNVFYFIFSSTYFTVYRGGGGSNGLITEKTILFQGSKGSNIFQGGGGGGPTFSRGGGGPDHNI